MNINTSLHPDPTYHLSQIPFGTFAVTYEHHDSMTKGTVVLVLGPGVVFFSNKHERIAFYRWEAPDIRTLQCHPLKTGESFTVII